MLGSKNLYAEAGASVGGPLRSYVRVGKRIIYLMKKLAALIRTYSSRSD